MPWQFFWYQFILLVSTESPSIFPEKLRRLKETLLTQLVEKGIVSQRKYQSKGWSGFLILSEFWGLSVSLFFNFWSPFMHKFLQRDVKCLAEEPHAWEVERLDVLIRGELIRKKHKYLGGGGFETSTGSKCAIPCNYWRVTWNNRHCHTIRCKWAYCRVL